MHLNVVDDSCKVGKHVLGTCVSQKLTDGIEGCLCQTWVKISVCFFVKEVVPEELDHTALVLSQSGIVVDLATAHAEHKLNFLTLDECWRLG